MEAVPVVILPVEVVVVAESYTTILILLQPATKQLQ